MMVERVITWLVSAAHAVHGVTHLAALCRLLAEREAHAAIYGTLDAILDHSTIL